ncbi:hypothetical protein [Streptomyces sp. DSM 118878]
MALTSCGALVALALIAGAFYWWGGPRERHAAQQVLDEACGGLLPSAEMRAVLGDGPYRTGRGRIDVEVRGEDADSGDANGGDARQVTCTVSSRNERNAGHPTHDASVQVTVESVSRRLKSGGDGWRATTSADHYEAQYPRVSTELPPAGLGQGWQGMFSAGEVFGGSSGGESASTAVLLSCTGSGGAGGLLVTVDTKEEDATLDDPRLRTAFARVATATAEKASEKWGCDAKLGEPLRTVPLPVGADEHVKPADASGTCAGLPGRGSRITQAWEDAGPGGGPVEVCVLGGGGTGTPAGAAERRLTLVAYYGPYAETERLRQQDRYGRYSEKPVPGEAPAGRLPGGGQWASAVCRAGGPALYTVRTGDSGDAEDGERLTKEPAADLTYERAALRKFAARSARSHACPPPKLP